jgi:hypothetical protein
MLGNHLLPSYPPSPSLFSLYFVIKLYLAILQPYLSVLDCALGDGSLGLFSNESGSFLPAIDTGPGKRKREDETILEQRENRMNPLRCPVKFYEFYLSKW